MDTPTINAAIDPAGVKGFLAADEGRRLYEIALLASRMGPCVEIGSYCGRSAVYIGSACRINGGTLFSIDHHAGSEEQQPGEMYFDPALYDHRAGRVDTFGTFRKTLALAGLEDTVIPIVCRSQTAGRAWSMPLSLLFIDGGHAYETVDADYRAWAGHVMPGGYLLVHDVFEHAEDGGQAPFFVYREALASGRFKPLAMTRSLGVLQRTFTNKASQISL